MRCHYCYETLRAQKKISVTETNKILDRIHQIDPHPDEIEIFGGEPFTNWGAFTEILRSCSRSKTRVTTSTNGLHLSPDKVSTLQEHRILLGISYDGKTTHDVYRRTLRNAGTERRVRGAIEKAVLAQIDLIVNMTLQKVNAKHLASDIRSLHEIGVTKIKINTVNHDQYIAPAAIKSLALDEISSFARQRNIELIFDREVTPARNTHYYHVPSGYKTQNIGEFGHWDVVGWI